MGSASLSVQYGAVMQVLEFFFLTGIMVVFRSRRFPELYMLGLNEINVSSYRTNLLQNPWMNGNNNADARPLMLAPLLETVITHKIFEDEVTGSRGSTAVTEEFKNSEQVVIVNPSKYTVKDEDEQQNQCDVSLNESFEDDEELIKEEKKINKKDASKKDSKKNKTPKKTDSTPTPKENQEEPLDPAEVMPNLQIGVKEKKRRAILRDDLSDSDNE